MTWTVHASSVGDWADCGLRWYYRNIVGLKLPLSPAAHLGLSIHHSTAVYDQARMEQRVVRLDEVFDDFMHSFHNPTEEVDWSYADEETQKAQEIGLTLTQKYCTSVSPKFQFRSIELEITPLEVETEHGTLSLAGRLDRTRVLKGSGGTKGIAIADIKTGRMAANKDGMAQVKGHKAQLGTYELLAEHSLGEKIAGPAVVIGLQTTGAANVGLGTIGNAKEALLGSGAEKGFIELMARDLKEGTFKANPRSTLCSPKYCPGYSRCKFHE